LFERTRRDFSHGCIRLQKADELAEWVLKGQTDWDLDRIHEAMDTGPNNKTVSLKSPIPIVIFYVTGLVEDDGHVHFFDDIYGYDAELQDVLANGPPYPVKPVPVVVKNTEDTL
jgi:L,D-transpeptidase YcbB